jgi:uncharacterized protein YciI
MWYAILGHDVPDSLPKRLAVRAEHLARLQDLQNQGRLLVAGPFPAVDAVDPGSAGFTGSLIVAEFSNLQEAQDWAATDPYVTSGVFAATSVKPYKKVLPA